MSFTKESKLRESNITPPGTLTPEMRARHKLDATPSGEEEMESKVRNGWGHRKKLKQLIAQVSLYRLMSHNVLETKLARPLVNGLGYFLNANKPEFRNRDRAPQTGNIEGQGETDGAPRGGVTTTY